MLSPQSHSHVADKAVYDWLSRFPSPVAHTRKPERWTMDMQRPSRSRTAKREGCGLGKCRERGVVRKRTRWRSQMLRRADRSVLAPFHFACSVVPSDSVEPFAGFFRFMILLIADFTALRSVRAICIRSAISDRMISESFARSRHSASVSW